jgi:hypothetical protein
MSAVLTQGSSLACQNQGKVALSPTQTKLTVGGQAALVDGDLKLAAISTACATVTDPNTTTLKCSAVNSAVGGVATKLTVGGKGVLLDSIQGLTNGTVGGTPQTWSVKSAGQTKLTTV